MTTIRKTARIISVSVLLTLALTLSAAAQSSQGATRLLTIYCPGMADVTIDGVTTHTRGPVRQYVLNYSPHTTHTVRIHITGKVGNELKSVSREVPLSNDKLNYVARFHPVLKEAVKPDKPDESESSKDCCKCCKEKKCKEKENCDGPAESEELKDARRDLENQEKKLAAIKAVHAQRKLTQKQAEAKAHKSKGAPVTLSTIKAQADFDAAGSALNARRMEHAAVTTSIETQENRERELETEIQSRDPNTTAAANAREAHIVCRVTLAGLRLQAARLQTKIGNQTAGLAKADTNLKSLQQHNKDVEDMKYWHEYHALNADVNLARNRTEQVGKQVAVENQKRLEFLDKVHELESK